MVNGYQIVFYIKKGVKIKRARFLGVILLGSAIAVNRSCYHDNSNRTSNRYRSVEVLVSDVCVVSSVWKNVYPLLYSLKLRVNFVSSLNMCFGFFYFGF